MQKRLKIEGSPESRFVQLMRKHGYSKDATIETATVISPPPAIKLRMDSDGMEIFPDEIVVAGSLLEHTRQATIDGVNRSVNFSGVLSAGDSVIVVSHYKKMRYFVIDKAVR